jgi:exoribonuclease R
VLIIAENKSYGRSESETKSTKSAKPKVGRLLYKCIPDDVRIPVFLVPYEIKQVGFSKVLTNVYVTLRYTQWNEKHPQGLLVQAIGPVDMLDNFYEYQLYCKSLHMSLQKFTKDTNKAIKDQPSNQSNEAFLANISRQYPQMEDRTGWHVFTIDPSNSLDFDDGFSISKLPHGETLVSIYIANVTIWMDALQLWSSFSQRISTIYLPDRKRPMLPTILSDCLCSLQRGQPRFAFVMDVVLHSETSAIVSITYKNALIKVATNFVYEERALLTNADYICLLETAQRMSANYKYISHVRDSHDVVTYLMIFMNYYCAQDLVRYNNGIFRSTLPHNKPMPEGIPSEVVQFVKLWNSNCAQYIDIATTAKEKEEEEKEEEEEEEDKEEKEKEKEKEDNAKAKKECLRHDSLEMDAYVHITSPIRRLVDLLNLIRFQQNHSLIALSEEASLFYQTWIQKIEYINVTMRTIRKVQHDCALIDSCFNHPGMLEKTYEGFCFDKVVRNDGLYQYIVFLPELNLASKITMRNNLDNFEKSHYKMYLFHNEEKFKRKIRLQLTTN